MFCSFKTLISVLTLLIVSVASLYAQQPAQRQTGIYKTYQEFLENKPSITKAFAVVRDTSIMFDELREIMDTTVKKVKYRFLDGSKIEKNIWGLCDSNTVFVSLSNDGLIVVDHLGKYPYMLYMKRAKMPFNPKNTKGLVRAINGEKDETLAYIDETGKCVDVNTSSLVKLLKPYKELYEAFISEKKKDNTVYEKYLRLINDHYATNP